MKFGEQQLKKYGWKKGQGLGKNTDGINKAIGVSVKNDTDGLGAKGDQWSFQWWDHVFNKATATIKVDKDESGEIQIKKDEEAKETEKKLLYGAFVKAGETKAEEKKDYSSKITDKELFEACEGRTARKGARAEQHGKLSRAGQLLESKKDQVKKKSKKQSKKSKSKKESKKSKKSKD